MSDSLKHCSGCDRDLPRTAFGLRTASRDGLQARCLSCRRTGTANATQNLATGAVPLPIPEGNTTGLDYERFNEHNADHACQCEEVCLPHAAALLASLLLPIIPDELAHNDSSRRQYVHP